MRVLIVANNISMRMGGEAVLPYHYVREMKEMGVDFHALAHARVRDELKNSELWEEGRFHFVEDAAIEKAVNQMSALAPPAIRDRVFMSAISAITGARIARRVRRLAVEKNIDIIHQPTPVSPKFPSFLANMPAPVVIGPMNGGMSFPPAFEKAYAQGSTGAVGAARALSGVFNRLIPGKLSAARILVANERTLSALPSVIDRSRVVLLQENGVDLKIWEGAASQKPQAPVFVFVGRLVWLKGVDLLFEAFRKAPSNARLLIIGDGPERARLEALAADPAFGGRIEFLGFKPQTEIRDILAGATALLLPSLHECGGAVILEAFACRTTAIATDWGGPKEYVTPETGILVPPEGREAFISGLAAAMTKLSKDKALAARLGEAAHAHVIANFSWRAKALQMIDIYKSALKE
ncbi:MAG: glycosyltransferase family 4 protein [Pseudomonadota bacterium]